MKKIFIDLGHGGHDSGAINGSNQEKSIVLSTGLKLKKKLESTGKFEIRLSRESDKYLTLSERSKLANNWGADIFVSLHCNSATKEENGVRVMDKKPNGLETFCYKFKYRKLADNIQKGILSYINLRDREVKEGNFSVIRETRMSACLVELGFISNDSDLNLLLNCQDTYVKGITKGILSYFNINMNIDDCQEYLPKDFDPVKYLLIHHDVLAEVNRQSKFTAESHYINHGKKEGRRYK